MSAMAQIDMVHDRYMVRGRRRRRGAGQVTLLRLSPALAAAVLLAVLGIVGLHGASGPATAKPVGAYRAADRSAFIGAGTDPAALLVEPNDGDRQLVRLIDRAQTAAFVEAYILSDRQIIRALERAAAQGVAVDVLLEPHPLGPGTQPQRVATELRAAGASVRSTWPAFALTHAKFMVLDDRVAVLASANFSHAGLHTNRDLVVIDRRPADVRAASAIFRADWDRTTPLVSDPNIVLAPDNARPRLARLLASAQRRIDIYAEELGDAGMEGRLVALHRRGVSVRIVLAAGQTPGAAAWLAQRGIGVRYLASPYVHAKMLLVDGREAFIGSENLSRQSLNSNREVGVLVRGSSLRRLAALFDRDWSRASPFGR